MFFKAFHVCGKGCVWVALCLSVCKNGLNPWNQNWTQNVDSKVDSKGGLNVNLNVDSNVDSKWTRKHEMRFSQPFLLSRQLFRYIFCQFLAHATHNPSYHDALSQKWITLMITMMKLLTNKQKMLIIPLLKHIHRRDSYFEVFYIRHSA